MTKIKPAYACLLGGASLILAFYFHIQPEYRLQLTCRGTTYAIENGNEVSRDGNAILGIAIDRYDVLWGDGAYVWTQSASDLFKPKMDLAPYEYISIENDKSHIQISEERFQTRISYEKFGRENMIIWSPLTKIINVTSKMGVKSENFDGECEQS